MGPTVLPDNPVCWLHYSQLEVMKCKIVLKGWWTTKISETLSQFMMFTSSKKIFGTMFSCLKKDFEFFYAWTFCCIEAIELRTLFIPVRSQLPIGVDNIEGHTNFKLRNHGAYRRSTSSTKEGSLFFLWWKRIPCAKLITAILTLSGIVPAKINK